MGTSHFVARLLVLCMFSELRRSQRVRFSHEERAGAILASHCPSCAKLIRRGTKSCLALPSYDGIASPAVFYEACPGCSEEAATLKPKICAWMLRSKGLYLTGLKPGIDVHFPVLPTCFFSFFNPRLNKLFAWFIQIISII